MALPVGHMLLLAMGIARAAETHGALRGAGWSNSTTRPNANGASGSSACDCWSGGCADRHCSQVNEIFQMIRFDRDGSDCETSWQTGGSGCTGGALLHTIGTAQDMKGFFKDGGSIDWLSAKSYGGRYYIINDCQLRGDQSQPPCMASVLLRSDVMPIVFTNILQPGGVHPIALLFDPWQLKETYGIKAMFVLDGDTATHPWWKNDDGYHMPCANPTGPDWMSDYDAQGNPFVPSDGAHGGGIKFAMPHQCYFSCEQDANWAGFWGNFINARKAFEESIRDADPSALSQMPDGVAYLESEIDVEIQTEADWDSMYQNALKAVVVQTTPCQDELRGGIDLDIFCGQDDEDATIRDAKLGACRVALQVKRETGNDLPVIEANMLTNEMQISDAWEQYRVDDSYYLANPEQYMQYYDCCWLLNSELYEELQAEGWYDGQCCWEQDDGGYQYWKNCDYCVNCQ